MFVYFLNYNDQTAVVSEDGVPVIFPSADDAWSFIADVMKQPNHPKMMWVKEAL